MTSLPVGGATAMLRPADGAAALPRHFAPKMRRSGHGAAHGRRCVEVPPRDLAACRWCGGDAASPGRRGGSPRIHARPDGGERETRVQHAGSSYQVMAFALSPW